MNKKIIIFSFLGLTILVGGAVFLLTRPLGLSLEQIFPSRALMFSKVSHVATNLDNLTQNGFWKSVAGIDLPKVLEHNKVPEADVKQILKAQKEMDLFFRNPLTKKFLGKEIAIGVYPRLDQAGVKDPFNSYDVLFATRLEASFQMTDFFVFMAKQFSEDVVATTENYGGVKITHVHFKQRKLDIEYFHIKDVLLVALSPSRNLHAVIDVYHKRRPSLAQDSDFSKAISKAYSQGHGFFYFNIEKFRNFLEDQLPGAKKEGLIQLSQAIAGFKSYIISFMPGEILRMKMIAYFTPEQLNSYWHSSLSCTALTNSSLKFVPHNVMAYQWGGCYDFKNILSQLEDSKQIPPKAEETIKAVTKIIQKKFKIDFKEDFLGILDSQIGGYLNEIDTQGAFPFPRMVFFLKFKDQAAAQTLMNKLTGKSLLMFQQEDYLQTPIHYMTLPLGANMDLGYAFLDDFLLLGTSKQLLKTSIDAFHNPEQSFQSTEISKQFEIGSTHLNQGMAFVKTDEVAQRLQQLLDWYNKIVSSQITSALTFQQETQEQQRELKQDTVSKKEELVLAQKKLKELQSQSIDSEMTPEEQVNRTDNLEHLISDIKQLKDDLVSNQKQQTQMAQDLIKIQRQSEDSKLWLFNSDEVFVPVLRGLGALHAFGLQFRMNDQLSETEILIK